MHTAVQRIRQHLLQAACPPEATRFEAATMYLYAVTRGRSGSAQTGQPDQHRTHPRPSELRPRPSWAVVPAPLADFGSAAAAERFRATLEPHVGFEIRTQPIAGGIRYRHVVHRVLVPANRRAAAVALLTDAWQDGARLITAVQPLSPSSERWRHRRDLAAATWRAALLTNQTVRTSRGLHLRTPSPELAAVLVRAARLLDTSAEVRLTRHLPVVCLGNREEAMGLLRRVGRSAPRGPADHRSPAAATE